MMINGIKNRKKRCLHIFVRFIFFNRYKDFIFVSPVGLIPFYFSRHKNWTKNHFLTVTVFSLLNSLNSNYDLREKSMTGINFNYCPNCGKKIQKSNSKIVNFCCYCGHKLKAKDTPSQENIRCTICHEFIWPRSTRIIKCSFCGSSYHNSCVHDWLARYNACPMCQNVFLNPNLVLSRKRK